MDELENELIVLSKFSRLLPDLNSLYIYVCNPAVKTFLSFRFVCKLQSR